MFHAAVFTACQMPDRSGLPSAVRGSAWPAAGVGASARMTSVATIAPISRVLIRIGLYPSLSRGATQSPYFFGAVPSDGAPRKKFRPSANFTVVPLAVRGCHSWRDTRR